MITALKKASFEKLHFRYPDNATSARHRACCQVVDVCVDHSLVDDIRERKQLAGDGVLVRLHWNRREELTDNSMSTLTLMHGNSSSVLGPNYAVAVATMPNVLEDFAAGMLDTYKAKLIAISYPPFSLIFKHPVEFETSFFTKDKYNLLVILKKFLSECFESGKKLELGYKIKKGPKVPLVPCHPCRCLVAEEVVDVGAKRNVSSRDIGCQTEMPDDSGARSDNNPGTNSGNDIPIPIQSQFDTIEDELNGQRRLITTQLKEQRRDNEELMSMILKVNDAVAQSIQLDNNMEHGNPNTRDVIPKGVEITQNDDEEYDVDYDDSDDDDDVDDDDGVDDDDEEEDDSDSDQGDQKERNENANSVDESDEEETVAGASTDEHDNKTASTSNKEERTKTKRNLINELILPKVSEPTTRGIPKKGRFNFPRSHAALNDRLYRGFEANAGSPFRTQMQFSNRSGQNGRYQGIIPGRGRSRDIVAILLPGRPDSYRSVQNNPSRSTMGNHATSRTYQQGYPRANQYSDMQCTDCNFDVVLARAFDSSRQEVTKTRIWDVEGVEDRLHLLIDLMIGDSPDRTKLWNTVEEVLNEEESSVPYVETALDTVICIDISGSVQDEAFLHAKSCVMDFINETEDIAERHELEENIALVTFGEQTRVLHHLSHDYGSLREALDELYPGGPSPMLEGVLVSLTCMNKGGEINFQDQMKLPPRLIIITDGLATGVLPSTAEDKNVIDDKQKDVLIKAFELLKKRQQGDFFQGEITLVPVGNPNMSFLLTLANSCGGSLIDKNAITKKCRHQLLHKHAAQGMVCIQKEYNGRPARKLQDIRTRFPQEGLPAAEAAEVRDLIQDIKETSLPVYGDLYNFNNILEIPDLPPLGSRVVRGPDWIWENQDTEGAGTIINHGHDGQYVFVIWDNTVCNVYRYGRNDCYDVKVVHDQPRDTEGGEIEYFVGLQVQRGPNWHVMYENQDGGQGSIGVIIRESRSQERFKVRWQDGNMYEYRHGENKMFDVMLVDPQTP